MTDLAFYQDLQSAADEILVELGKEYTYRSFTGKVYEPATGKTFRSNVDSLCKAAIFPIANQIRNQAVVDKIQFGDKEVLMSAKDFTATPQEEDQLIEWLDAAPWTITENTKIAFTASTLRITDGSGSNGFATALIGQNITVYGSTNNNGTFTVTDVAAEGSYVRVYPTPSDELAGASVSIASRGMKTVWSVVVSEPLEPAGVTVLYDLYVRKVSQ
jgi:hypothetical protein